MQSLSFSGTGTVVETRDLLKKDKLTVWGRSVKFAFLGMTAECRWPHEEPYPKVGDTLNVTGHIEAGYGQGKLDLHVDSYKVANAKAA